MQNSVKYVVDEQGHKREVLVPIHLWETLRGKERKRAHRKIDRKKLSKYFGKMKLTVDPLRYQKEMRNEWK
ncbi:MAG: hypothetical protein HY707_13590 [Ignavibacteriae bacterium]|nr:hypothetical protein [Ignavibacteriota bacterium]